MVPRLLLVVALTGLTAGCVSRASMKRMQEQLDYLEVSQKRVEHDLIRIDSLSGQSAEASRRTRADIGASLDEIRTETQAMREAIEEIRRQNERRPVVTYQPPPGPLLDSGAARLPGDQTRPDIDPSQLYENAFLDVRNGNYELAIAQFRDVLQYFGQSEYAPNARYWIGESWYSLKQYDSAVVEFESLVTTYPQSDRISTALYKLGRCYEEKGMANRARRYYQQVIKDHPASLEAKPAQSRLSQIE
jgi:tol-pal system protein YbgF